MWISIPTEQTTAWTDLILTILALACLIAIKGIAKPKPIWTSAWIGVFGLLALASFLGALAHGIQWTPQILSTLWFGIYSCLSLAMAFWCSRHDYLPVGPPRCEKTFFRGDRQCPIVPLDHSDLVRFLSAVFSSTKGLFCWQLSGWFSSLFFFRRVPGTGLIALGIALSLVAAYLDTRSDWILRAYWEFDHHGIFHLVQMPSIVLLGLGVVRSHQSTDHRTSCD